MFIHLKKMYLHLKIIYKIFSCIFKSIRISIIFLVSGVSVVVRKYGSIRALSLSAFLFSEYWFFIIGKKYLCVLYST